MVYDSSCHGFCNIFPKRGKSEISQSLLFILFIIIYIDLYFFNSRVGKKTTIPSLQRISTLQIYESLIFLQKTSKKLHIPKVKMLSIIHSL